MQGIIVLVALTIAMCTALAQDALCVDIIYPPACIDSNTTITPVVDVKNNGSEPLPNVPVSFNIVSEPTDTIFFDSANSGQIGAGATKRITFAGSCTPELGAYTMTCITELPGDTNRHNDTLNMPLFVRYLDVAVEIVSPRDTEEPGSVEVRVRLINLSNVPALVQRLIVIRPGGWVDSRENIALGVGESTDTNWGSWVYDGGVDTVWAWITSSGDSNHANDTDMVVVHSAGISNPASIQPRAGIYLELSPSPLAGNVLGVEYSLKQAGRASVTLFDVSGRPVATSRFVHERSGEFPMDLRRLSGGVYLVRLDDGRAAVTQKLVVQL
jgi:hypothetical protein